jgi:hypothetical protein
MSFDLAQAINNAVGKPMGMRVGIVTSVVSATQITATVGGTALTLPYLNSYVPVAGDNVIILFVNAAWVALGAVG